MRIDVGDGGIVDVKININAAQSSYEALENAATAKAEELYGGEDGLAKNFE